MTQCVECRKEREIHGHGLCNRCYKRNWRRNRRRAQIAAIEQERREGNQVPLEDQSITELARTNDILAMIRNTIIRDKLDQKRGQDPDTIAKRKNQENIWLHEFIRRHNLDLAWRAFMEEKMQEVHLRVR